MGEMNERLYSFWRTVWERFFFFGINHGSVFDHEKSRKIDNLIRLSHFFKNEFFFPRRTKAEYDEEKQTLWLNNRVFVYERGKLSGAVIYEKKVKRYYSTLALTAFWFTSFH